jgi:hypothetical protein
VTQNAIYCYGEKRMEKAWRGRVGNPEQNAEDLERMQVIRRFSERLE